MTWSDQRSLATDLVLLCATSPDGRIRLPTWKEYALAGALLADLALNGNAVMDKKGRRISLLVGLPLPPDPLSLHAAGYLSGREARVSTVLRRLAHRPPVARLCLASLAERGLLTHERRRALGIIPWTAYFAAAPAPAIPVTLDDPRSRSLAALLSAGELDRRLLPGRANAPLRRAWRDLARADPLAREVASAIRDSRNSDSS